MSVTEAALQAAARAPRVSEEEVEAAMAASQVSYTVLPNGRTTVAQVELFGGRFSVEGQAACVSKENFNLKAGSEFSLKEAKQKVWSALGTVLAWKLSLIDAAPKPTGAIISLLGSRPLTYVGVKVVHAVPMSRDTFLNLKDGGTRASAPDELGYLVEYVDGGTPNVEGFAGYISWSPKDVFEKAYTVGAEPKQTTFLDRLRLEHQELKVKYDKLRLFLTTAVFGELPAIDQRDLKNQADCMEEYVWILAKRIQRAEAAAQ